VKSEKKKHKIATRHAPGFPAGQALKGGKENSGGQVQTSDGLKGMGVGPWFVTFLKNL
jgi:hypothetical protein